MPDLTVPVARQIIERVGGEGIPPEYGFQFFTAGVDPYLSVLDEDYLKTFISDGGSTFKMVVGVYGGGKTHFLYCVRDAAWNHEFVASHVALSPKASPFHSLDLVYRAIVLGLVPPMTPDELLSGYEHGLPAFLRRWYAQSAQRYRSGGASEEDVKDQILQDVNSFDGIENISFAQAMRAAVEALAWREEEKFLSVCQWLTGEGYDRQRHRPFGILQKIDKSTAFGMFRSLAQWLRQAGYKGIVVLLDEGERVPSMSTAQRQLHLQNLRELIDECGHAAFQGVMVLYAVPDEGFLEGRAQVYEALKQRVSTVFDVINPSGVKIELERLITEPEQFLHEVGVKLAWVYGTAYGTELDQRQIDETVRLVAEHAYTQRFADIGYKRLFVQKLVQGLHYLRAMKAVPSLADLE